MSLINNGSMTVWSPIHSVIIRVINKIGWQQSESPSCQCECDYREIGWQAVLLPINQNCNNIWGKTRHLLYVFIRKQLLTPWNAWQQLAQTMLLVHVHKHDKSTVLLHCPITSIDCPIGTQIGLVITNHVLEFYYSFD